MEVKVSDTVTGGDAHAQRFFGVVGTESPLAWSRPPGCSSKRASWPGRWGWRPAGGGSAEAGGEGGAIPGAAGGSPW